MQFQRSGLFQNLQTALGRYVFIAHGLMDKTVPVSDSATAIEDRTPKILLTRVG